MRSEQCRPTRTDAELLRDLLELAGECRAPTIAADARRSQTEAPRRLLNLCFRLRHHLFEMQRAIGRTRQQWTARLKAIDLARSVAEQQLDLAAHTPDAVRARLATRLVIARTKFVMATKADALVELSLRNAHLRPRRWWPTPDQHAHEIATNHLATFWMRTVTEVHTPVIAFAATQCTDFDASLTEMGEVLPADAFADVSHPPLGTFFDEMSTRITASRDDLGTQLETGAHAITGRLLDYYDHAICATDARFRERLDSIAIAVRTATMFADAAHRTGDAGIAQARQRLAQWSATLGSLLEDLA